MTLLQLQYFLEVTKTLSFTKAADNLFVAQSSLSHSILALERELEVPLFIRQNGKKLRLSRFGEALLPYATNMLETAQAAADAIVRLRDPLDGVVKLTYSYINGYRLVPKIFEDFYKEEAHRNILLDFQISHGSYFTDDALLNGSADLAINCTTDSPGTERAVIAQQKLVVALPLHHPLAEKDCISVEDLKNETILCYHTLHKGGKPLLPEVSETSDSTYNLYGSVLAMFRSVGIQPTIDVTSADWSSVIARVALDAGVSILPELPLDAGSIAMRPLAPPFNRRDLYLVWANSEALPPVVEYVRQYILNWTKAHP